MQTDFQFNVERMWRVCKRCVTIMDGVEPDGFSRYNYVTAMLLFGTAAQESGLGWERQRSPTWSGDVGGFSKWQVEEGTITRTLRTICALNPRAVTIRRRAIKQIFNDPHADDTWFYHTKVEDILWCLRMDDNDHLGVFFAREHYRRVPELIPLTNGPLVTDAQIMLLGRYWKDHYNTYLGAGTVEQFVDSFTKYQCKSTVFSDPLRKQLDG